jgi:hypothetical protein
LKEKIFGELNISIVILKEKIAKNYVILENYFKYSWLPPWVPSRQGVCSISTSEVLDSVLVSSAK